MSSKKFIPFIIIFWLIFLALAVVSNFVPEIPTFIGEFLLIFSKDKENVEQIGKLSMYAWLVGAPSILIAFSMFAKKNNTSTFLIISYFVLTIALVVIFYKVAKPVFAEMPKKTDSPTTFVLAIVPVFGWFHDFIYNFQHIFVWYSLPIFCAITSSMISLIVLCRVESFPLAVFLFTLLTLVSDVGVPFLIVVAGTVLGGVISIAGVGLLMFLGLAGLANGPTTLSGHVDSSGNVTLS